jgi:dTDP-4-dehydrorhamnose reductase
VKIVLYGAGGRVGWELRRALAPLGELLALDIRRPGPFSADVTQANLVHQTLQQVCPDVIVNAAAYTNVDGAEVAPQRAFAVNGEAPAVLAEQAAALGAWLVHYGTDYVFDGRKPTAYLEDDAPAPLNVYGRSKLQGEQAVRASGVRHLILRVSWIHCPRRPSFAGAILERARLATTLDVASDQVGVPTGADLVADVTAHVLRTVCSGAKDTHVGGTYNLSARGAVRRDDYARHVLRWAHEHSLPLAADADAVRAVPSASLPNPVTRPANSLLDVSKLESTFGLTMPDWQPGLERMLTERYPPH